jgi:hypothetical protein
MSYLRYLCVLAYSDIQHILCFVFRRLVYPMLPVSLDCPYLNAPSVFSNIVLCLVYPMLPGSLDCAFCIAPSVFSNVFTQIYMDCATNPPI